MHYVWRKYLESWGWTTDGKLTYLTKDYLRNTSLRHPESIGHQPDFYTPTTLSFQDLDFIKQVIVSTLGHAAKLDAERDLSKYEKMLANKNLLEMFPYYSESTELLDRHMHNYIEDIYGRSETEVAKSSYLEKLSVADSSFFHSKEHQNSFVHFVMLQYLRTLKMKERVKQAFNSPEIVGYLSKYSDQFERAWCFTSVFLASDLSSFLAEQRVDLTLLQNNTDIPLITCDQPVVNLRHDYEEFTKVNEMEAYYPITPTIAVLLTYNIETPSFTSILTNEDVLKLNDMMFEVSHKQVYASNSNVLQKYLQADNQAKA